MRRARIGADDAIKLRLRSEVQQKAYLETRSAQVIQKLPRGGSMQLRCRFDLDYQHIVDDQVEPLRAERLTFVHDLDVDLTRDTMPSLEELALVVKDPLL